MACRNYLTAAAAAAVRWRAPLQYINLFIACVSLPHAADKTEDASSLEDRWKSRHRAGRYLHRATFSINKSIIIILHICCNFLHPFRKVPVVFLQTFVFNFLPSSNAWTPPPQSPKRRDRWEWELLIKTKAFNRSKKASCSDWDLLLRGVSQDPETRMSSFSFPCDDEGCLPA